MGRMMMIMMRRTIVCVWRTGCGVVLLAIRRGLHCLVWFRLDYYTAALINGQTDTQAAGRESGQSGQFQLVSEQQQQQQQDERTYIGVCVGRMQILLIDRR